MTCTPCPLGFYQTEAGKTSCNPCTKGFTTWNIGTYKRGECKGIFPEKYLLMIGDRGHYVTKSLILRSYDGNLVPRAGWRILQFQWFITFHMQSTDSKPYICIFASRKNYEQNCQHLLLIKPLHYVILSKHFNVPPCFENISHT